MPIGGELSGNWVWNFIRTSLRQQSPLKKPEPSAPMLPWTLRPCAPQLSRMQKSPASKLSKEPRPPMPAPSGRLKLLVLWPSGMPRPRGPLRPKHSTGNMPKPCETWRNKSSKRKAEAKLTFISTCQAALHASSVEPKGMLVASYCILMGQAPTSHPFTLSQ